MAPGTSTTGSPRPPLLVLAVLAVGLLGVLAAASATPWRMSDRFGIWGPAPTSVEPATAPSAPPPATPPPLDSGDLGRVVAPVLWVLLVVGGLVLAVWLWRVLPRHGRRRQGADALGAPVLGQPDGPSAPAVQQGVGDAQHLLDTVRDPTDAVLAAWVALEQAAERSGVPRRPADTPTEFTVRVLSATAADTAAVQTLLGLYHRARFAAAGVGPDAVQQARRCLDVLAASWSRFSAVQSRPEGPRS